MEILVERKRINELIEMIGAMASLDFSKRIATEITDQPIDVMAYGLNMLSEELEANMVRKSMLEETNRNLERFGFTVAHDIKSPLSSAYTLTTLIEDELEGIENQTLKNYIQLLKGINEQTREMVNGILDYSRTNYNNMKKEEVDLKSLLDQIKQEYSVNESIHITFSENLPIVNYNAFALKQILGNLINNAVKHNDKPQCKLEIQHTDRETFYEISVTDNGPGIAITDKEKVFDLFENLRSDKENSHGVGLSIVKKLVTQANGSVWVDTNNKSGAKFIFTIDKPSVAIGV